MLGPVHVQAKRPRPQDPKRNEESPAEACKFLEEERRRGHPVIWGQEEALTLRMYAVTGEPTAGSLNRA